MVLTPSLNAHERLRASMTVCSWRAGWRSLLLRGYDDPPEVEPFTTAATADLLVVLVVSGACRIEARYSSGHQRAEYESGCIGTTAPGEEATIHWRGTTAHSTLQLHLPAATLRRAYEALTGRDPQRIEVPSVLSTSDPLIQHVIFGLANALRAGAPDLYAETAGDLLATHLLVVHAGVAAPRRAGREDARLCRVDAYMRESLGEPLSLEDLAEQAGVSRFHLVRLFKEAYGETPLRRLTRFRMEEAQRRLAGGSDPVTEIAFHCGYENPAHFASAFRRVVGVSPSAYRLRSR